MLKKPDSDESGFSMPENSTKLYSKKGRPPN